MPVIVKPVDSSGSKGTTVLHEWNDLDKALDFAFSFSRSHKVIVEEYIEKKNKYLIGGDIFVLDGKVVIWGLMNCHRDERANPLVPVGKSYPAELNELDLTQVKKTLQRMVNLLHFRNGAINVELVVNKNDRVWPIDIGPRSGGNMIPDLLGYIFDTDIVEMSLKVAMGENVEYKTHEGIPYYATHNLHSIGNGQFDHLCVSAEMEPCILKKCVYKRTGDSVEFFDNAAKALGIVFMKFRDKNQMDKMLEDISAHIRVALKD